MFAAPYQRLLGLALVVGILTTCRAEPPGPVQARLGVERCVFQTTFGDIEFGFFHEVAPVTAAHMLKLCQMGAFNTNHVFRVDKGFVAQVQDVVWGRQLPLSPFQKEEADKTVPLEVKEGVKHVTGVVSMGRHDDPNSATSSFSMLLGPAPHLDMQYGIFGQVTSDMEPLRKMEEVPTKTEGIFVMPLERITILSSYVYYVQPNQQPAITPCEATTSELKSLEERFQAQEMAMLKLRKKMLP